jgi:hypothetical protein
VLFLPARLFSYSLSVGKGEYLEALLNFHTIMDNLVRLEMIFTSYITELFCNLPHWGVLWLLLILSALYNRKRFKQTEVIFVGITLLFYFGVLTIIFIILPWNLSQFFACSLARLIMHLAPVTVYFIGLLWAGTSHVSP